MAAESRDTPFTMALLAGACAGTTVDVSLHPLDTLKTRFMSKEGFWKSGGLQGTWKGVVPIALGSAPSAACFFSTYETAKGLLKRANGGQEEWYHHSISSSLGELVACSVRVPSVMLGNILQVGAHDSLGAAVKAIHKNGGLPAFWNGFGTMVARDIPFAFLQFPIYEGAKKRWADWQGYPTNAIQGACCGSVAGSIAGAATCPLEVAKTRIFIDTSSSAAERKYVGTWNTLSTVAKEEGAAALFKGIEPRVFWITLGGFVFFGAYEQATRVLWTTGAWD
jgi:solute carrier family 25 S-adenosylmethionine transporter 26